MSRDPFKGRHRHPNRPGRWIKRGASVFTVSLILGAVLQLTGTLPAHAATIASPAQEAAACAAVYHFHHVNAVRYVSTLAAWDHVWHEANYADPEMRTDIHRWLTWGYGWSLVRYDCNPDEGL